MSQLLTTAFPAFVCYLAAIPLLVPAASQHPSRHCMAQRLVKILRSTLQLAACKCCIRAFSKSTSPRQGRGHRGAYPN